MGSRGLDIRGFGGGALASSSAPSVSVNSMGSNRMPGGHFLDALVFTLSGITGKPINSDAYSR